MHKTNIIKALVGLFIILALFGLTCLGNDSAVIGEVYGPEHEYIKIGNDTYTICENPGITASDRSKKLGKAVFKDESIDPMIVWSIDGFDAYEYIYTLWVYDGAYNKKDEK